MNKDEAEKSSHKCFEDEADLGNFMADNSGRLNNVVYTANNTLAITKKDMHNLLCETIYSVLNIDINVNTIVNANEDTFA